MAPKKIEWIEKKQPKNDLAERRNIKLSVKIPDVLGTGVQDSRCIYIRTIDFSTKVSKSHETSPVKTSSINMPITPTADPVPTPDNDFVWDDQFMYMMFF